MAHGNNFKLDPLIFIWTVIVVRYVISHEISLDFNDTIQQQFLCIDYHRLRVQSRLFYLHRLVLVFFLQFQRQRLRLLLFRYESQLCINKSVLILGYFILYGTNFFDVETEPIMWMLGCYLFKIVISDSSSWSKAKPSSSVWFLVFWWTRTPFSGFDN